MATRQIQQNQTQEKILETATQLFYEKGVQSVGVDEIVLQAGIAKMTLYKYFASKDQLVMAVVERSEELWWQWFSTELRNRGKIAKKQLLAIFDILFDSFENSSYKGEPFLNARIRVLDNMYPICLTSVNFRSQLKELILDLVKQAQIPNPKEVSEQLMLLIIGVNILSTLDSPQALKSSLRSAKKLATTLIKTI